MPRLKNKIALITGAAQGIGAATAKLFVEEGATVIVTDINTEKGTALAEELGAQAEYQHLDVAEEADWQRLMQHIQAAYGRLDALLNNAGIIGIGHEDCDGPQDPEHVSLAHWRCVHRVNLDGVFLGCKCAIQLMKGKGGSIINMSSRSGLVGIPGAAPYASSKAAIRNHTKTVALYCAQQGYNIRCNTVLPGAIHTPLWDDMLGDDLEQREAQLAGIAAGVPLGRMGKPEEVGHAVVYLASEESQYLTGSEIVIDGGLTAGTAASPGKPEDNTGDE